ncbi:hypothetical protein FNH22_13215 [Fulvivirga sp. M361]|uniref:hypothetical protein n=1 Tax=Fulvivirga sp. M361 TaxID=2594266 RepID=UPI00117A8C51|nr:hypothetical protein [Fulvivirga sp. M361]TRX58828.1 hypothetical protein FNH22_13215 [Fulvivirga sp. M361]
MKKILSTILLTLTLIGTIKADLGAPAIQAICKVTLKDGNTVEGIITFGPEVMNTITNLMAFALRITMV